MAVNLATKYSSKVDEKFHKITQTDAAVNKDYDWNGVEAINVYGVSTATMNNYSKTGTTRYGTAAELDNTIQTMTLSRDRSFTFTIDRGNKDDSMMVMDAGKALARQIREVIVPEVDIYRLGVMSAAAIAAGGTATAATTASNAYAQVLAARKYMTNNLIPDNGRMLYANTDLANFLLLDQAFIKATETAQKFLIDGEIGKIAGMRVIEIPDSYLPANTSFIACHKSATVAAQKLIDYKTHVNPPGVNGNLVEGRLRYDAFVLDNKNKGLYVHKIA
jgi:N4-gp56 family major capsid protein